MTTIVVFASSLSVASILLITKAIELRGEKKNLLLKTLCRFDSRFAKLVSNFKFAILRMIQIVRYIALVWTKEFCKEIYRKVIDWAEKELRARQDTILTGRKDIHKNGSASFYLKKITEVKNGDKGKIEDDNLPA